MIHDQSILLLGLPASDIFDFSSFCFGMNAVFFFFLKKKNDENNKILMMFYVDFSWYKKYCIN